MNMNSFVKVNLYLVIAAIIFSPVTVPDTSWIPKKCLLNKEQLVQWSKTRQPNHREWLLFLLQMRPAETLEKLMRALRYGEKPIFLRIKVRVLKQGIHNHSGDCGCHSWLGHSSCIMKANWSDNHWINATQGCYTSWGVLKGKQKFPL